MCYNKNSGGLPVAQQAAPAPTRESVTAGAATDPTSLVEKTKNLIRQRLGVFGNVRTSPMGDASYGAFARFGPSSK